MINFIKKRIPRPVKRILKQIFYFPFDQLDLLLGRRDALEPPKRMIYVGGGDFKKSGQEFLRYFIEFGMLRPNEKILDMGCGIGRMAVPLTQYLTTEGRYEGLDIFPEAIRWCTKHITPPYPNFHFHLVDICNKAYNPTGVCHASDYRFPYADASFDFVMLTSVFTHMLPHEMEHYLSESVRVLRKGGRCFITFFLLNNESTQKLEAKLGDLNFEYSFDGYRTIDKDIPEGGIAFYEDQIRRLYESHGLRIIEPIRYGSWCGRTVFLSYQDIVIAVKD